MSEKNNNRAFDEQTLAKVLEAAYVLQEHNREQRERDARLSPPVEPPKTAMRGPQIPSTTDSAPVFSAAAAKAVQEAVTAPRPPKDDYPAVLAQVVETQRQIQSQRLELESTMALVVERAADAAHAGGAAIGILANGRVRYHAATGLMAPQIGTEIPIEKALCTACLRIGQVIRCSDVNLEFLVDAEECRRRGIQSMIAAPVYHEGAVAGALELFYQMPAGFYEPDVHTCQLMAGLVSEVMARDEESPGKKSLETERAAVHDSLKKLKADLGALVELPVATESAATKVTGAPKAVPNALCLKCGCELVDDEQFCGECGSPRPADYGRDSMQSKVAMLWQMQVERKQNAGTPDDAAAPASTSGAPEHFPAERSDADLLVSGLPELFTLPRPPRNDEQELESSGIEATSVSDATNLLTESDSATSEITSHAAEIPAEYPGDWSSAAAARAFLERMTQTDRHAALARFLKARRGDIYLAVAVILVAVVIRWGIWSDQPVGATGNPATAVHHKPGADLPFYDRMLIKFGLAEAPDPPEYKGNPNTQVWVDAQTALYYCPGADLYGKTPKGTYRSQRDAQLDSYEPAYRKPCD